MMSKLLLATVLLGTLSFVSNLYAQDAWLLNEFYSDASNKKELKKSKEHYKVSSALYSLDLTGNGVKEFVGTRIVDGVPRLSIYDAQKNKVFEKTFPISGFDSHIYRLKTKKIAKNKVALLIYLFNGNTNYIDTFGSSSLWSIVIQDGSLKDISIDTFGNIWSENEDSYGNYKRAHQVDFQDVNHDGQLDLVISSGSVLRAYSHMSANNWQQTKVYFKNF